MANMDANFDMLEELRNDMRQTQIHLWKNRRWWWRNSAILDGAVALLQLLQGAIWWEQDRHIFGGLLFFCAGFMVYQTVSCVRKMREIRENIAGMEALMRQEGLWNDLSEET